MEFLTQLKRIRSYKDFIAFFDRRKIGFLAILGESTFVLAIFLQLIDGLRSPYRDSLMLLFPITIKSLIPVLMMIWLLCMVVVALQTRYECSCFALLQKYPAVLFLSLAISLAFISEIYNGWKPISVEGDGHHHEGLFTYFRYLLVYFPLGILVAEDKYKITFVRINIILSTAIGIFGLWKNACIKEIMVSESTVTALWDNSNHYGYYLAINTILVGILFVYEKDNRLKIIDLLILTFHTIVLTYNDTFGAWLAIFTTFVLYIVVSSIRSGKLNKEGIVPFGVFILITLIMSIWNSNVISSIFQFSQDIKSVIKNPRKSNSAGSSRWRLWKATLKYISEKPLLGWGVEGITERLNIEAGSERTHNEYLQYAAFFGIPNAICYVTGCACVFLRAVRLWNDLKPGTKICVCGALSYFISAAFGISKYYTTPLFFIFLGLGYQKFNAE